MGSAYAVDTVVGGVKEIAAGSEDICECNLAGSQVSLFEVSPHVLAREDLDAAMIVQQALIEDGKLERARDLIEASLNRMRNDSNTLKPTWNKPTPTR